MTTWYVDSVSGSDSNGGTATNDALASFSGVTSAGMTGGDAVYVKGAGATYAGINWSLVAFGNKATLVSGYTVTPGDNCDDGSSPPIVLVNNTNEFKPAIGMNLENFVLEADLSPSPWAGAIDFNNAGAWSRNMSVHITDTYSTNYGIRSGVIAAQGYRHIYGARIFADPGCEIYNSYGWGGSGVFRSFKYGCIWDFRNISFSQTSGVGTIAMYDSTNHGSCRESGNFYLGNAAETHSGMLFKYQTSTSGLVLQNCVFYNLDIGLDLTTDLADSAALLATYANRTIIENCFFVNCRIGIQGQDGIEIPYLIRNNIFYNCTEAQTSGSFSSVYNNISATQNPIDIDTFTINSYGRSLLNTNYPDGWDPVGKHTTRDQIYELPIKTKFVTETSGSLSLGTGDVGDTVIVSGRSFQKISDNPIAWRRV